MYFMWYNYISLRGIEKLTIGERIGLLVTILSIASGVTLYSHSQTNHLNKKCPLADLYGDNVIEHSINEVKNILQLN